MSVNGDRPTTVEGAFSSGDEDEVRFTIIGLDGSRHQFAVDDVESAQRLMSALSRLRTFIADKRRAGAG